MSQPAREPEPLVSIVTPVYNDAATLGRAIESCLAQTLREVEVVVVDDASTDGTAEVAASYAARDPRVRVFTHEENLQILEGRRTGCRAARAPHMMYLDADDWLDEQACERMLAVARDSGADVVCCSIVPEYAGYRPAEEVARGRAQMYAAPELDADGVDVVHATYRDDQVVWSLNGKLFETDLMRRALKAAPSRRMFQCEDAYLYFLVSYFARAIASRPDLPSYHYTMGIGGTRSDASDLSAADFSSLCRNVMAARGVEEFLSGRPDARRYDDDVAQLRFRLLADPTIRFPHMVSEHDRPAAFDALVGAWPAWEAIGWLAARHWEEPAEVARAVVGAASLAPRWDGGGPVALYVGPGTEPSDARHELGAMLDFWGRGEVAAVLCDAAVAREATDVLAGLRVVELPDLTGGRYPGRSRALAEALATCGAGVLACCGAQGEAFPWDVVVARTTGARVGVADGAVPRDARPAAVSPLLDEGVCRVLRCAARLAGETASARGEAATARDEAARARARAERAEGELADVRGSVSFRVGRALTALPRRARDALRS